MDNKEAIIRIKNKRDRIFVKLGKVAIVDALDLAIKSMEQVDALDKIKAEIKDKSYLSYDDNPRSIIDESWVLEIIDKYTAESKIKPELNYTDNDTCNMSRK